jgi:hypothetical protein
LDKNSLDGAEAQLQTADEAFLVSLSFFGLDTNLILDTQPEVETGKVKSQPNGQSPKQHEKSLKNKNINKSKKLTAVGFEPTPFRTRA